MTEERVRRPLTLALLDLVARALSPRFLSPLHLSIQAAHIYLTKPILERLFRLSVDGVVEFKLRRSVTSWRNYHVLLSDLDITLVVDDDFENWTMLKNTVKSWRRRLIFLGEFEVYTRSEESERKAIEERLGSLHSVVRDVRKLSWLKTDSRPYHGLKVLRSIAKIQKGLSEHLGGDPSRLAEIWNQRVTTAAANSDLDPDMFNRIINYLHSGHEWLTKPAELRDFLRVLPVPLTVEAFEVMPLEHLKIHIQFCRHERILAFARGRVLDGREADDLREWSRVLSAEIARCEAV